MDIIIIFRTYVTYRIYMWGESAIGYFSVNTPWGKIQAHYR